MVDNLEYEINIEFEELTRCYEKYESSRNQTIVLGSIDYMRIALRESNLNLDDKYNLLIFIKRYYEIIREIKDNITPNDFMNLNLDDLEELFDQFQEFASEELKIIKRIDDDEFDESLCYY